MSTVSRVALTSASAAEAQRTALSASPLPVVEESRAAVEESAAPEEEEQEEEEQQQQQQQQQQQKKKPTEAQGEDAEA